MSETQHPAQNDPHDHPEDDSSTAAPGNSESETGVESTDPSGRSDPAGPPPGSGSPEEAAPAAGRRVTRRTVNRREVTEHTQETITEDIPLEAYQGPGSTHPAPVG